MNPVKNDDPRSLEIELSDDDILDAMKQVQGYVDVFADDFRIIYHLAHRHAVERLTAGIRADALMRRGVSPLYPDVMLDVAARAIVTAGCKGLPVVNRDGIVIGVLTETDFLRHLRVKSFLELLLHMMDGSFKFANRCHETPVSDVMTAPAVCVPCDAGFRAIFQAFRAHKGRAMPVVDEAGKLEGVLARKDFLDAAHMERFM